MEGADVPARLHHRLQRCEAQGATEVDHGGALGQRQRRQLGREGCDGRVRHGQEDPRALR